MHLVEFKQFKKPGTYSHDNNIALVCRLNRSLRTSKRIVCITINAMYCYNGLSSHSKVDIVGDIVHEHTAVPDFQARPVNGRPWDFWE